MYLRRGARPPCRDLRSIPTARWGMGRCVCGIVCRSNFTVEV
ncbi:hypothetical protein BRYFOR_08486 [Marvinbryantia formatexigens DSM 14469]|uniref:Uncharacterized protein n=1 Tax=Marvinbryantia formatexigens DSM 14469 TaxID=478749 RepID=C6LID2_9FIRM|nr:hypothetical protein BRYFOR_08486 [Marvinbryantia formatexigens DSM 14469]